MRARARVCMCIFVGAVHTFGKMYQQWVPQVRIGDENEWGE